MDAKQLANALGVYEEIAALLVKRGVDTLEAAKAFLYPRKEDMAPAAGIANIDMAVERIRRAVEEGETILIFGDYDCDGICAATILTIYLRSVGANVHYHIPRRASGYGLSEAAVEQVVGEYLPDLLITVDCGITACAEVQLADELGVDVIVTDHHEPQAEVPECIVVNPKLGNDERMRNICGAAVAMKLVEALAGKEVADDYLDLAALATVADVVPLLGENRLIVSCGLGLLKDNKRKGLRALIKACGVEQPTSSDVSFRIAPHINALGRLNDDADVVELFITDDDFVVRSLVEKITAANTARQTLTKQLVAQAYLKLQDYDLANRRVIVLWDDKWESGVLGLVASRLVGDFGRPVVLLTNVGECYKGSARSIPGVNIFAALSAVSHRMITFGGHQGAAGMSVRGEMLKTFADELDEFVSGAYAPEAFVPRKEADIVFNRSMKGAFFADLARMEPFGEGNPSPKFVVHSADCRMTRIGETEHVKCRVSDDVEVVAFGKLYLLSALSSGVALDYYCDASRKVYQNREYMQLAVGDVVTAGAETMRDSAPAFGNYLKTVLYPPKEVGTRVSNLAKEIADLEGTHGVLWVAFGVDAAREFLKALSLAGKRHLLGRIAVARTEPNPVHTLLLAPQETAGWQFYSSIVFLDAPLSVGYLAMVGAKAPNPELVLLPHYAFMERIRELHLETADVEQTLRGIRRLEPERYHNPDEMCMRLSMMGYNVADVYAHFYILYEIGAVVVGSGFRLQFRADPIDPSKSRVYQNLMKLRERV